MPRLATNRAREHRGGVVGRSNGAKSWELAIAHTLHLSRTRGPEILYTLPRVARGGGMPLVAVALLTLQGGVNNGQHRRGGHTFARFMTLLTL